MYIYIHLCHVLSQLVSSLVLHPRGNNPLPLIIRYNLSIVSSMFSIDPVDFLHALHLRWLACRCKRWRDVMIVGYKLDSAHSRIFSYLRYGHSFLDSIHHPTSNPLICEPQPSMSITTTATSTQRHPDQPPASTQIPSHPFTNPADHHAHCPVQHPSLNDPPDHAQEEEESCKDYEAIHRVCFLEGSNELGGRRQEGAVGFVKTLSDGHCLSRRFCIIHENRSVRDPKLVYTNKDNGVPSIWTDKTERSSSVCMRAVVLRKATVTSFVLVCSSSSPLPLSNRNASTSVFRVTAEMYQLTLYRAQPRSLLLHLWLSHLWKH